MSDYRPERPTGRASVRPGGYREPESGYREQGSGYDELPAQPMGRARTGRAAADGPMGPTGVPPAAGRATVAGAAPVKLEEIAAVTRRGKDPAALKKRKRRNRIVILLAVCLMLTGLTFITGTYYFTSVPLPSQLALAQISRVYSADGQLIGQIGEENRTVVQFADISKPMKDAMVAAEDRSFYKNAGVDFRGMVRALWNNLTGGDQQGASTITQQYARIAANLSQDASYSRKAKEAVIAMKLGKEYTKDQILNFYLNTVDFGRGTSGIQAAAQAYFGVNAKDLTVEQSAVIAGMVKSPGGYYEPDEFPDRVKERWGYVMDSMVATGAITKEQRASAQFPKVNPHKPVGEFWKKPVYQIVKYVKEEMAALNRGDLKTGGYNIYTSIDMRVQAQAEQAASGTDKGDPMRGQNPAITAALVATEPTTGRVLAYYGGPDGTGSDFAGYRKTSDGKVEGEGFHAPGSTAKVYVLADALKNGYSVNSLWDGTSPKEFPDSGRAKSKGGTPVSNSDNEAPCGNHCTLRQATVHSLNTPFFAMTEKLKASTVLETMRDAGVQYMTPAMRDDKPRPNVDVKNASLEQLVPDSFQTEIGIGQYPITVLQHSAGLATFANEGTSVKQHFITKVAQGKDVVFEDQSLIDKSRREVVTPEVAAAMDDVLKDIHADRGSLKGGRVAAAKTGTWQVDDADRVNENGDVWITGYTPQIATAVWVGSKKDRIPLYTNTNPDQPYSDKAHRKQMYGSGLPGSIWKQFMENAHDALKLPMKQFPQTRAIGDPELVGNGVAPSPSAAPTSACPFPPFCIGGNVPGNASPTPGNQPSPPSNDGGNVPPVEPGLPQGRR